MCVLCPGRSFCFCCMFCIFSASNYPFVPPLILSLLSYASITHGGCVFLYRLLAHFCLLCPSTAKIHPTARAPCPYHFLIPQYPHCVSPCYPIQISLLSLSSQLCYRSPFASSSPKSVRATANHSTEAPEQGAFCQVTALSYPYSRPWERCCVIRRGGLICWFRAV